jgi:hypothetical protein
VIDTPIAFGETAMRRRSPAALAFVPAICLLAACESDESTGESGHTPDEVVLTVDGLPVDTLRLTLAGATRVVLEFYHDGELLDGTEADHHSILVFTPPTLATDAPVAGANFSRDVTGDAVAGTLGTVMVGWGHEEAADDEAFGPFDVKIE